MKVAKFLAEVASRSGGGSVTAIPPFDNDIDLDVEPEDMPIDFPSDIVSRWIPGTRSTDRYPGRIADIVHSIPIDGVPTASYGSLNKSHPFLQ